MPQNHSFNKNLNVDLQQNNRSQSNLSDRVQCNFELSQSQPILDDTTNYELSITRFNIETTGLPVFIPTMNNSESETAYVISFQYGGMMYKQSVMFSPQNLKPLSVEEYFYIYNYNYFIRLLNITMETLVNSTGLNISTFDTR